MLDWLVSRFGLFMFRFVTGLRYRVTSHGLEKVKKKRNLKRKGGILFLPNHSAQTDPLVLCSRLWRRWKVRPVVTEGVYYLPGLHLMFSKYMNAVPVPAFERASNSYKVMRNDDAIDAMVEGLKKGDNFVIYPSGRLKRTADERVGGASMVWEVFSRVPEANIVLVRSTGLWGSMYSWGLTGQRPPLVDSFVKSLKIVFKNLLFFVPKRKIRIDYEIAPDELYEKQSRSEFNRWLEQWYNLGAGQPAHCPGEPTTIVSYSRWKLEYPAVTYKVPYHEVDVSQVPLKVQRQVIREVARLSKKKTSEIRPEQHLFTDLGLDSLDIAELITTVEQSQGVVSQSWHLDLLTVGAVMALVAGGLEAKGSEEPPIPPPKGWIEERSRPSSQPPEGETIVQAFLETCDRMGDAVACVDQTSGLFTYTKLKQRAIAISRLIQRMPGNHIGILLPSTVAVQVLILACWLANKRPVMINWTIGSRYLEHVKRVTGIESVISSWAFLDNLDGVDLTPIHRMIRPAERLRVGLKLSDLRFAKKLAKKKADEVLKELQLDQVSKDDEAVILFTSGTEALPKAVPLTHHNILENQRSALARLHSLGRDVMLSILPPFHSFGFSITGLLPLLTGLKVVYSPDPTDAPQMIREIMRYNPTILCSPPTFLNGIFNIAKPQQLESIKLFICGAEKSSPALFQKIKEVGPHVDLMEGYGITECSPILTLSNPGEMPEGVGRPIPGVEIRIVHYETLQPQPSNEPGLILVRGPNVFKGYHGEQIKSPFVELEGDLWYNTGDLGYLDADNNLILEGRLKRFVKVGGEMVSLPGLEAGLEEAAIREQWGGGRQDRSLAVVAVEQEGDRPALYLFGNFFIDLDEANEALRRLGFSNLARLQHFEHVADMPRMGTGKIDYRALQEKAEQLHGLPKKGV